MRFQTSQNEHVDIKRLSDVLSPLQRFCNVEQHNLVSGKEIRISNIKACAFWFMAKSYSLHLQKHFCWLTTIHLKAYIGS
jgi:hypothetical protein